MTAAHAWQKRKRWQGLALLVAGLAIMGLGALWAGREAGGTSLNGIWLGSGGALVLAVGGLFVKWGLFGPLPQSMREDEP